MPKGYEEIRDKLAKKMDYDSAQAHAAAIWNSQHPENPVNHGVEHPDRPLHQRVHDALHHGKKKHGG